MACIGYDPYLHTNRKGRRVRERLLARGLDPRSNGFMRAFFKAMNK